MGKRALFFNGLTGLRQHTGNWIGKISSLRHRRFSLGESVCELTDLPGIYSLRTLFRGGGNCQRFYLFRSGRRADRDRRRHLSGKKSPSLKQLSELPLSAGTAFLFCINLCDEAEKRVLSLISLCWNGSWAFRLLPVQPETEDKSIF